MSIKSIPLRSVTSSNMKEVGYEEASKTLVIVFKRGGKYSYKGVPKSVYDELMDADSKGTYFHEHIKNEYPATPH